MAADAAGSAFDAVRSAFPPGTVADKGKIILATVKGDIHDIGKNICRALLENYGFKVIDLGRDVSPEAIVAAAKREQVRLVGLSALMTTTVGFMEETIRQLHAEVPGCQVTVGGAVLTAEYAKSINADHYTKDAMELVRLAESILP
jgi:5-methyltetrahydrofolate--homocysteine methyltransferase